MRALRARLHRSVGMTRSEQFEALRPLLFSVWCQILASVAEAEDAL